MGGRPGGLELTANYPIIDVAFDVRTKLHLKKKKNTSECLAPPRTWMVAYARNTAGKIISL